MPIESPALLIVPLYLLKGYLKTPDFRFLVYQHETHLLKNLGQDNGTNISFLEPFYLVFGHFNRLNAYP